MPTTDYSKTVIYVIKCRDDAITDEYVGSTTNFRSRKCNHKSSCNNENSKDYNMKIYQFIRANGGWNNFIMIQLEEHPCKNKREAECREEQIRQEKKASLNAYRAFITAEQRKEQLKEKAKEYYQEHKEQLTEYYKEYRKKNAEQIAEYYQKHKEQKKEKAKEYYQEHKEQIKEYQKTNYHTHKKQKLESMN